MPLGCRISAIQLRPTRLPLSKINARTRSGKAELILPIGAKLDLKAAVKKGQIENDFGEPFRVGEDGRAATLTGSNGGPEVKIEVDRGDIEIRKWTNEDAPAPSAPVAPRSPLEVTKQ